MSGWITNLHIQIEDIQIYHIFKKKNYKNYTQGKFCVPQKLHLHFLHGKNQKRSKGQAKGKMCWYLTLTLHYSSLCTCKWNRYCISVMWRNQSNEKFRKESETLSGILEVYDQSTVHSSPFGDTKGHGSEPVPSRLGGIGLWYHLADQSIQ